MTWHIDMREVGMNIEEAKMQNYKIKVANEAESKEAQELLFKLGYDWGELGKSLVDVEFWHFIANHMNTNQLFYCHNTHFNTESQKEITLPQLRDLTVLHRNDVSDATHVSDFVGHKFFVASDNKAYEFREDKWQPKICKSFLEPIVKQEFPMTWQDALRAVADGKEVEYYAYGGRNCWCSIKGQNLYFLIDERMEFRLAPQRKELNGNFTKEELLKIVGEMV